MRFTYQYSNKQTWLSNKCIAVLGLENKYCKIDISKTYELLII